MRHTEDAVAPVFLSISAAAKRVGLSRTCIYRLIDHGKLPCSRLVPDAPRVRQSDLDALLSASWTEVEVQKDAPEQNDARRGPTQE